MGRTSRYGASVIECRGDLEKSPSYRSERLFLLKPYTLVDLHQFIHQAIRLH